MKESFVKNKYLSVVDVVNTLFWLFMLVFYLITFRQSAYRLYGFFLLFGLLIFQIIIIKLRKKSHKPKWIKLLLLFYPVIYLVLIFDSLHLTLPYMNPNIYDAELANIDFQILGVNPTVAVESIINPYLTELMYILYFFYFPMPLLILGYLYKKKMFRALDKSILFLFLTYYGSYLIYYLVPALGPRFYEPISSLQQVNLDGLWLTDIIRDTINSLEHNKFDAFPSLHTAISLTTFIIIAQYRKNWLPVFIPIVLGIFISLIYCRYHYFIDIVAGVLWTLISFWITEKYYNRIFIKKFIPFYSEN